MPTAGLDCSCCFSFHFPFFPPSEISHRSPPDFSPKVVTFLVGRRIGTFSPLQRVGSACGFPVLECFQRSRFSFLRTSAGIVVFRSSLQFPKNSSRCAGSESTSQPDFISRSVGNTTQSCAPYIAPGRVRTWRAGEVRKSRRRVNWPGHLA